MWDYTDKVLDHFRNPRNVGTIENPDGVGMVGSMACGDALKLMFKLDEQGRIADVKFQTFGCASAIASASALTELIKGKTLEEAEKITNKDIVEFLGGLPEQKMHCSVMGREALLAAIENYRTGKKASRRLEGKIVCQCFGVTENEIERVIRENNLVTVEQVTNYTKAGGGCGKCKPQIREILTRANKGREVVNTQSTLWHETKTIVEKIKIIEEILDREVRPLLRHDGGNVELLDIQSNTIYIAFRGRCSGCKTSHITLKDLVENKLRQFISPEIEVKEVK